MRVLVTGHHGYIGSVMVPTLQQAGHDVVGLDTFYFQDCDLADDATQVESLNLDIRKVTPDDLRGFDAIVHLAALSNDPMGDLNADWTYDINMHASVSLARAAREAGVTRFIYSSSCSIYGASGPDDVVDEESAVKPLTPYAESKIRAEEALRELATENFSPIYMRNATAYGVSPRLRVDLVLNNLVAWAYTTGKIRIMSDGTPWRPIVHIRDISGVALALLEAPQSAIHNQAFNVGASSETYQVRQLAEIVKEIMPECVVEIGAEATPDPRSYRVNFDKLRREVPSAKIAWNAKRGAAELANAYRDADLKYEDFQGQKFIRLNRLKELISSQRVDDQLFWTKQK